MAGIEFRNVSKSFGTYNVIQHLDVTIQDGSFTVLVGPSGCGKTTLLRMIAGIGPQSDGWKGYDRCGTRTAGCGNGISELCHLSDDVRLRKY